jgi:DNA invertase Pin-like site-specific DNA recombinase
MEARLKGYGYVRCSSLGGMDGDGPIRQRTAIQKFADEHGIEIVSFYEESHTGSDLEGRTEFKQMRSLLVSNGVRLVIVEKLDRLARSIMVQETILADFKKHDIELKSATPGEDDLCGEDPTRTLIRQILGCFFEYERKMIESKLRAARQRMKVQKGKCEGQKAFGILPGEEETLRLILEKRELFTPSGIAQMLNTFNHKTRYGKKWHSGTVSKILKRESQTNPV